MFEQLFMLAMVPEAEQIKIEVGRRDGFVLTGFVYSGTVYSFSLLALRSHW